MVAYTEQRMALRSNQVGFISNGASDDTKLQEYFSFFESDFLAIPRIKELEP